MASEFQYLFTPLKIGPVTVRNRLMSTSHATLMGEANSKWGEPSFYGERYAYYQAERAKGGIGLIIFGQTAVHPTSAYELMNTSIAYDESAIPGFKLATDMIHKHGAKVFNQLFHSGLNNSGKVSKLPVWAPSAVPSALFAETPMVMEIDDIKEIVEHYGISAENSKAGGFDGVEIHASHGYLPQQFLSPFSNQRTDEYGGSLENRMRFLLEVVERIRDGIGSDMALGIRLCGDELTPGGLTLDDSVEIARRLAATGKIDYLSISLGNVSTATGVVVPPMYMPQGYGVYAAAAIKEAVDNIPVFCVGRITDPLHAEKILADGQADMVGMTRAHIADPEIGNKAREGRLDEIRQCVGCCQDCFGNVLVGVTAGCTQNPEVGSEKELGAGTLETAPQKKKVIVIGGGRAGMEVARVSALRGHKVILYEKSDKLGGQINLACRLPGRDEMESMIRWPQDELKRLGVEIIFNKEVTVELIEAENPDAVVVATGSKALRTGANGLNPIGILGSDQKNVYTVEDVLLGKAELGQNVVILDTEGHIKAAGIAELLADQGKHVEIITDKLFLGMVLDSLTMMAVQQRTASKGVQVTPSSTLIGIKENSVDVLHFFSQEVTTIEAVDSVVLITGAKAIDDLYLALKNKVKELYRVGDCVAPRTVDRAIHDGYFVGRSI